MPKYKSIVIWKVFPNYENKEIEKLPVPKYCLSMFHKFKKFDTIVINLKNKNQVKSVNWYLTNNLVEKISDNRFYKNFT